MMLSMTTASKLAQKLGLAGFDVKIKIDPNRNQWRKNEPTPGWEVVVEPPFDLDVVAGIAKECGLVAHLAAESLDRGKVQFNRKTQKERNQNG